MKISRITKRNMTLVPANLIPQNENQRALVRLAEQSTLSRTALFSRLLDPRRNYDTECGYPSEISAAQYKQLYKRMGVAQRVVGLLPRECWLKTPEVYEVEDAEETEFEKEWNLLLKSSNLWFQLHRIDEISGVGRFGILLLGLSDGKALDQPVLGAERTITNSVPSKISRKDSPRKGKRRASTFRTIRNEDGEKSSKKKLEILYMRAFSEDSVLVDERETDPKNKRFGQPKFYSITFDDEVRNGSVRRTQKVHWSRVIHVADNCLESEVFGSPRMEVVMDRLLDLKKVLGGGAEMFWRGGFPGIALESQTGVADADFDQETIRDEMESYQNGLQRYLGLVGVNVKSLAPQISDPTATYNALIQDICITLGVPQRIFMGTEAAQLASGQDKNTWNDRLMGRCEEYLTPRLVRPVIDRLIAIGVLPQPKEYTVLWEDRNSATEDEKAKLALTITQVMAEYLTSGVDVLIPPDQFLTQIVGMEPDEVEAILAGVEDYLVEKATRDEELGLNDPPADPNQDGEEIPKKGEKTPPGGSQKGSQSKEKVSKNRKGK